MNIDRQIASQYTSSKVISNLLKEIDNFKSTSTSTSRSAPSPPIVGPDELTLLKEDIKTIHEYNRTNAEFLKSVRDDLQNMKNEIEAMKKKNTSRSRSRSNSNSKRRPPPVIFEDKDV